MEEQFLHLLNSSECLEILSNFLHKEKQNLSIVNYEITPVTHEAMGFLGEYYLLNITAHIDLKESRYEFFIKTLPVANEGHREIIKRIGVFSKETVMYDKLLKELKKYETLKWHPDCFYTREDIIVMENLVKYDYRHLERNEIYTEDHIKVSLKSIASMHACSLVFEEKTSINIGEKYKEYFSEIAVQRTNGWFNAGLQAIKYIASKHPKCQNVVTQKFIENELLKKLEPIYEIIHTTKFHKVTCHRDIWNKNIFFKFDKNDDDSGSCNCNSISTTSKPIECIFVDFQHFNYQPPAFDVLLFIYFTTNREFREKHLEK